MGKRSTKENKNIYQIAREEAGFTRSKASDIIGYISADRIEKIESEKSEPHPDEILAMSKCYKKPNLCNYYCSKVCSIGQEYVPEVEVKDFSLIILEMLATLNSIDKDKNRLIEIAADGKLTEDEIGDFTTILTKLNNISLSVDALTLWIENTIANGQIDPNLLATYKKN